MATFSFHCPFCKETIETEEEAIGQSAPCPFCGKEITVERDSSLRPPAAEPSIFPGVPKSLRSLSAPLEAARIASKATGEFRLPIWLTLAIFGLLLVNLIIMFSAILPPRWEYKVTRISGEEDYKSSVKDFLPKPIDQESLKSALTLSSGWELVACVPEVETVHPNFGKEDYVTGIQPNARTNGVLLIFRKRTLL